MRTNHFKEILSDATLTLLMKAPLGGPEDREGFLLKVKLPDGSILDIETVTTSAQGEVVITTHVVDF